MRYTVIATLEAQAGIRESFKYIYERAPLNAARWLQGVWDKINTLERLPERCPRAREAEHLKRNLRQLLYKSHRIVFSIISRSRLSTSCTFATRSGEPPVSLRNKALRSEDGQFGQALRAARIMTS